MPAGSGGRLVLVTASMIQPWTGRLLAVGALLLGGVAALSASTPAQGRAEFTEVHMGVPVRLVVHAGDGAAARAAARAAYARIADLDAIMSDYRAESEVRRLADVRDGWTSVSPELFEVLARALEIAQVSDGVFDPTVGPLVALWREARREGRLPDMSRLARARARVGWRAIEMDSARRAVRLARDSMRLDLGGIAKGYILHEALGALRAQGVPRALIEAGGDLVLGEAPPGKSGWTVSIAGRDTLLSRVAVATSGPTEQFVEIDGVRYSHVIDVRTGLGARVEGVARIVTVIADNGATADAIATALSAAGGSAHQGLTSVPGVRLVLISDTPFPARRE